MISEEATSGLRSRFLIEDVPDGDEENSSGRNLSFQKKKSKQSGRKNSIVKQKFNHKLLNENRSFKCEVFHKNSNQMYSWTDFNLLWNKFIWAINKKKRDHTLYDFNLLEKIIKKDNNHKVISKEDSLDVEKVNLIKNTIVEDNEEKVYFNSLKDNESHFENLCHEDNLINSANLNYNSFGNYNQLITNEVKEKINRSDLNGTNIYGSNSFVNMKDKFLEEFKPFLNYNHQFFNSFKMKDQMNYGKNNYQALLKKSSKDISRKKYSEDRVKSPVLEPIFMNVKQQFNKPDEINNREEKIKSISPDVHLIENKDIYISNMSLCALPNLSENSNMNSLKCIENKKSPLKKEKSNGNTISLKISQAEQLTIYKSRVKKFEPKHLSLTSGAECLEIVQSINNTQCVQCRTHQSNK